MEHTYESLKKLTVAQLRKIAAGREHEALKGYTQLNKEHLLDALCKALGIDTYVHHEVKGVNKTRIKQEIRQLKKQRDAIIATESPGDLKVLRRQIHDLKRKLRRAMV